MEEELRGAGVAALDVEDGGLVLERHLPHHTPIIAA